MCPPRILLPQRTPMPQSLAEFGSLRTPSGLIQLRGGGDYQKECLGLFQ